MFCNALLAQRRHPSLSAPPPPILKQLLCLRSPIVHSLSVHHFFLWIGFAGRVWRGGGRRRESVKTVAHTVSSSGVGRMKGAQATLLLQKQLRDLLKHPVDGFSAGLVDDSNVFEWNVTIIGPPDTLYDGGFFNAIMSFPNNYPNSPPQLRFTSEMWHPNVYPDGRVCISILHAPGDDPNGYELASERWSPVHTVETILLSVISMLSSPNDESPANIDAAKLWRENKEEFKKKVGRIVRRSQDMA